MKKLIALVLALAMVATLGLAFADDNPYSITIKNESTTSSIIGKTYSAYKVFDLTLGNATTTGAGDEAVTTYGAYSYSIKNTDWAWSTLTTGATTNNETGVITTKYGMTLTPSAADPTVYVVGGSPNSANARSLADALTSVLPTTAAGSVQATAETATISLPVAGYYAVYGKVIPKDPNASPVEEVIAALALTSTDPTAEVQPKAEVPPLDKKITGEHKLDAAGKAATAEVGTTVSFELDSKVPDLTGYTDYTFTITDTMTSGLTFTDPDGDATNDVMVKVNDANKTSDCTISVSGQTMTVTIPFSVLSAAQKGQDIVVTYSAVVNSAALTTDYEKNTAYLTYSNNPSDSTTNRTPDKTVYVIDVDLNVDKIAGTDSTTKLSGATFLVFKGTTKPGDTELKWYHYNTTTYKVEWVARASADPFVTGNDGKFSPSVRGLEAEATGTTYGLLETVAPTGYNLLKDPVIVTLTGSIDTNVTQATVTASNNATVTNGTVTLNAAQNNNQPLATAQVSNNAGTELPSTGGIGTTIFYIVGGLLVIGAAVILVARRKAHE